MRIYYIANARMPTEKAHGIQIAKMCEAFIELGFELMLIVPKRSRDKTSIREYYGLRVDIPIRYLPAFNWYNSGRVGYFISALSFMFSVMIYALYQRMRGKTGFFYTVGLDSFSFIFLPIFGPVVAEMHGIKNLSLLRSWFFRLAKGIVAVNAEIGRELKATFSIPDNRMLIEPNGVDQTVFEAVSKEAARRRLSLKTDRKIVLYVGRFYAWKGLEILPPVSLALAPNDISVFVLGGRKEEFIKVFGGAGAIEFGEVPPGEVAMWIYAADVLLLLGTRVNEDSYRYTAPMKTFEYLASGRPVIASRTPALQSFVPDNAVIYCDPDSAELLVGAIRHVLSETGLTESYVKNGRELAKKHTWAKRAERICKKFIKP